MLEAVAAAAGVPLAAVRRAAMFAGSTGAGRRGRARPAARRRWRSSGSRSAGRCGRCSRPAPPTSRRRWPRPAAAASPSTASSTASASRSTGTATTCSSFTRSLDDITDRLPEVVEVVARAARPTRFVLDGEAIALDRRRPAAAVPGDRVAHGRTRQRRGVAVTPYFFDLLHVDGEDLLDAPGRDRFDGARRARRRSSTRARGW